MTFLFSYPYCLLEYALCSRIPNLQTSIYNVLNLLIQSRFRVLIAGCNVHLMCCAQFPLMSNDNKIFEECYCNVD